MKSYFKVSLTLVASLVLLLGCSKQASTPVSSSTLAAVPKKTKQLSQARPNKAVNNHLKRKMRQKLTHLSTIANLGFILP